MSNRPSPASNVSAVLSSTSQPAGETLLEVKCEFEKCTRWGRDGRSKYIIQSKSCIVIIRAPLFPYFSRIVLSLFYTNSHYPAFKNRTKPKPKTINNEGVPYPLLHTYMPEAPSACSPLTSSLYGTSLFLQRRICHYYIK